jgi:hypothetical protein
MASMVSTVSWSAGTTRDAAVWTGEGDTGDRLAVACSSASGSGIKLGRWGLESRNGLGVRAISAKNPNLEKVMRILASKGSEMRAETSQTRMGEDEVRVEASVANGNEVGGF